MGEAGGKLDAVSTGELAGRWGRRQELHSGPQVAIDSRGRQKTGKASPGEPASALTPQVLRQMSENEPKSLSSENLLFD